MAHEFLWKYRYKRLKLAHLLGQLGAFLTECKLSNDEDGIHSKNLAHQKGMKVIAHVASHPLAEGVRESA